MTPGGNSFNYFPENRLTKFKLCPQLPYFCPQMISVTHFASPGVPLDAPALIWFIIINGSKKNKRKLTTEQPT